MPRPKAETFFPAKNVELFPAKNVELRSSFKWRKNVYIYVEWIIWLIN